METQRRFPIGSSNAQITAIRLGFGKRKVTRVQAQGQRKLGGSLLQLNAIGRRVDHGFLLELPVVRIKAVRRVRCQGKQACRHNDPVCKVFHHVQNLLS